MSNFSFATTRDLLEYEEQDPPRTELSRRLEDAAEYARDGMQHQPLLCRPLINHDEVACAVVIPGSGVVELAFRDYPSATFTVEQINVVTMLLRLERAAAVGCPEREAGDTIALEGF